MCIFICINYFIIDLFDIATVIIEYYSEVDDVVRRVFNSKCSTKVVANMFNEIYNKPLV